MWRYLRGRRTDDGAIPVHVRPAGSGRWRRGRALWVHDVLAFRAGRGTRREERFWVVSSQERTPTTQERWWIHHLGGDMVVGTLRLHDGCPVDVAARRGHGPALFGAAVLEQAA